MTAAYTGQLRERLRLETRGNATIAAEGDPSYAWSLVKDAIPARIEPIRVGEATVGERLEASAAYSVTIRWRPGVSNGMRFVWSPPRTGRTVYLSIEGIQNVDERRKFMTIICQDLAPDASAT